MNRDVNVYVEGPLLGEEPRGPALIAFMIQFIGITIFFGLFEYAFFVLLMRTWYTVNPEIWILQVFGISGYILILFFTYYSRIIRIILFIGSLVLSVFILGVIIWINALTTIKVILIVVSIVSVAGLVLSFKCKGRAAKDFKSKVLAILIMLSITFSTIASFVIFLPRSIEIDPTSEPELIFWCGASQLPNDSATLMMANKYNIGFVASVRNSTAGSDHFASIFKHILSHGVKLHLALGMNDGFFLNMETVWQLPSIYTNIRNWLDAEGILQNPYLVSFCVDAEPPHSFVMEMASRDPINAINYAIEKFPTRAEIEAATVDLQQFIDAVNADGKEAGMARAIQLFDKTDYDGDLSLLTQNVYSLDVKWNYTTTMLYRTNVIEGGQDFMGFFDMYLGAVIEGNYLTMSKYHFYQNVALEQTPGDARADEQYIFIGNYDYYFSNTEFIINKEYKKDLDIARHFGENRVFLYNLGGFLYHYGWAGVEELGIYNQQHQKWTLTYTIQESLFLLGFYGITIIADLFSFFERDLT